MVSVHADGVPVLFAEPEQLKFSPSAWERWLHCPGSAWVSAVLRSTSSKYAQEGTAAHEVLDFTLKNGPSFPDTLLDRSLEIDAGVFCTVTKDMIRHAIESAATIRTQVGWICSGAIQAEQWLVYQYGKIQSCGRCDVLAVDDQVIVVIDYKYGQGLTVNPWMNLQLVAYALAARQQHGRRPAYYLGILQPRGRGRNPEKIRWWIVTDPELDEHEKTVCAAIDRARYWPPSYCSGEWCRWCPGKFQCPAIAADVMQALVMAKAENPRMINVWALDHASAIRTYLKQMEVDAFALIDAGGEVPGYGIAKTEGKRRWLEGVKDTLVAAAISHGWAESDVIRKEEKPITIGDAEKLGIDVSQLTEKPRSRKLVKQTEAEKADSLEGF